MSDGLPMQDELCRRFVKFCTKCLTSDCALVRFVSNYGIYTNRMKLPFGKNAMHCADKYGFSIFDIHCVPPSLITNLVSQRISAETVQSVSFLLELVFLRSSSFDLGSYMRLSQREIKELIDFVSRPDDL